MSTDKAWFTLRELAELITKLPPKVQALRLVRIQVDHLPGVSDNNLIKREITDLLVPDSDHPASNLELTFEEWHDGD